MFQEQLAKMAELFGIQGGAAAWFLLVPLILMVVFFIIFLVMFIFVLSRFRKVRKRVDSVIKRSNEQNNLPTMELRGKVVSKRAAVIADFTRNFITLEQDGGSRVELFVSHELAGMIAEGDYGTAVVQGTNCISFTRG